MTGKSFSEAIRLRFETLGLDGLKSVQGVLTSLGDASQDVQQDVLALLDALDDSSKIGRQVTAYEAMEAKLIDTARQAKALREEVDRLGEEFVAAENPSKRLAAEFQRKSDALAKLEGQQSRYAADLQRAGTALKSAGVDTARLASEEGRLAVGKAELVARLNQMGKALGDQRARQDAANTATQESATAAKHADGAFAGLTGKVKGLIAAAAAYVSITKLKDVLLGIVQIGNRFDQLEVRFSQAFGSMEAGAAAMERVRDLARDTPQAFGDVAEAALKLKSFGLDPLDGTMQALIDQSAALGGSQETLNGIILATGQAWAKQKLQGEEILQLVERGVPVWDLLSKATGKNVQELQKLSSEGKLGQDVIRALIAEIGKANQGAAAQGVGLLSGAFAKLRDEVDGFFNRVADSGPMQFFRGQIDALTARIRALGESGELDQIARRVGESIVAAGTAIKNAVQWVYEYSGAIMALGKAFVAAKIASFAGDLLKTASGWKLFAEGAKAGEAAAAAATGTMGRLRTAVGRIPTSIKIGIAVVGYELLERAGRSLGEWAARNSEAGRQLEETTQRITAQMREQALAAASTARELAHYKDVQIQTAQQVAAANDAERAAYEANLTKLREYLLARHAYLLRMKEIGEATKAEREELDGLGERLTGVRTAFTALADGVKLSERAMKEGLTPAALAIRDNLEAVGSTAKDVGQHLSAAFKDRDFNKTVTEVGDIATALAQVAAKSNESAQAVRDGLSTALKELSGRDLLAFQSAAIAAFDSVGAKAGNTGLVLTETLRAAMTQLGLSAQQAGKIVTDEGKDIIAAFAAVAENAGASADQIQLSFNAALAKINTSGEAQRLGDTLTRAANEGRISFEQAERAAAALKRRMAELDEAARPLAGSFAELGIKSQAELRRAADAARDAFNAIVEGARNGQAAQEDVRRGFEAYAEAARAAVADSTEAAQRQVEAQLEVRATALGLRDALAAAGEAGKEAGDKTAEAMDKAATSAAGVAQAASGTAAALAQVPAAAQAAAAGVGQVADSVTVLNAEQVRAMELLHAMAREGGDLSRVGVANARYILDQVGGMIGSTAQVLQQVIADFEGKTQQAMQTAQRVDDMIRQLEDAVLNQQGDQAEIERRRLAAQMESIRALEEEAGVAGNFDTQRFARLRELAQQDHRLRMREIEERAAAEKRAAADARRERDTVSATSGGSSGAGRGQLTQPTREVQRVVRVELPDVGSVDVAGDDDADRLIKAIGLARRAGRRF